MVVEFTATQILIGLLSLLLIGWLIFCIVALFSLGREYHGREHDQHHYGHPIDAIAQHVPLVQTPTLAEQDLI